VDGLEAPTGKASRSPGRPPGAPSFKRLPPGGPFRGLWSTIGLRAHKETPNMRIGVPKEVKDHEDRVGLVPSSVAELVHHGHQVIVEKGAGIGSGLSDAEYTAAGATLHDGPEAIFSLTDMIVKVKEPLPSERKLLRSGQVLFTYFHLAADLDLTRARSPAPASERR
jgi:Alanine dehydrogenase/PNT, N-terminal domain